MTEILPLVSVLLSVAGDGDYLADAIKSILNQEYTHFEFLIMNDGASEKVSEILSSFDDPRIKIMSSVEKRGLTASLNVLFKVSEGEFIARMDADDISFKTRFQKQAGFLQENPDVILVGSWIKLLNLHGEETGTMQFPVLPDQIRFEHYFRNPIVHPSIMVRRSALEELAGPYREELRYAQDYDLMVRVIHLGNCVNLPDYLLGYRKHPSQVSMDKQKEQRVFHLEALENLREDFKQDDFLFEQLRSYHENVDSGNRMPSQMWDLWGRVYTFLTEQDFLPRNKNFLRYVRFREILEAYRNRDPKWFGSRIRHMLIEDPLGLLFLIPNFYKSKKPQNHFRM